jgi:hypothetical protein
MVCGAGAAAGQLIHNILIIKVFTGRADAPAAAKPFFSPYSKKT